MAKHSSEVSNEFLPFKPKRVWFKMLAGKFLDMEIKLKAESLRRSFMIGALMTGYINNDSRIMSFLNEYTEKVGGRPAVHYKRLARKAKAMKETKMDFNIHSDDITEEDIEDIFDIIEEESSFL